jgi:SAM-dependent methyltransferase
MTIPRYNQDFFDYVNEGAIRSARRVLPILAKLNIASVLDVGCGQGAWLSVWRELGVENVLGIDGEYVDRDRLYIGRDRFVTHDLHSEFELKTRFDLVQCLEVAEHLPAASAETLVGSLTRHADMVLFSAAAKGQGGENHINEQSYEYWRRFFAEDGFVPLDCLRRPLLEDELIEPWYRYNMFLYVRNSELSSLPESLKSWLVPEGKLLKDLSPVVYKIRKVLIRFLPVPVVSALSRFRIALLLRHRRA